MNTLPKLILLLCLIAASADAATMKEAPKGMYIFSGGWLSATNQAVTSAGTAISNANCDGVRWKLRWSDIEANPYIYTMQDTPGAIGRTIPVPGDTVFITRWHKFITDFGARYDSNPAVSYIIITGIGNHDEWDIAPGTQDTAALGSTLE